jgi:hypothetical protein
MILLFCKSESIYNVWIKPEWQAEREKYKRHGVILKTPVNTPSNTSEHCLKRGLCFHEISG